MYGKGKSSGAGATPRFGLRCVFARPFGRNWTLVERFRQVFWFRAYDSPCCTGCYDSNFGERLVAMG